MPYPLIGVFIFALLLVLQVEIAWDAQVVLLVLSGLALADV
jgi:hypothetical protein